MMQYTCPQCHASFEIGDSEQHFKCPSCGQGLNSGTSSNAGGCLGPAVLIGLAIIVVGALAILWNNVSNLEVLSHYGFKVYGLNIVSFWRDGGMAVGDKAALEVFQRSAADGALGSARPAFALKPGETFFLKGYFHDKGAANTWMAAMWWDGMKPVYGFIRLPEASKDVRKSPFLVRDIDGITSPIYEKRFKVFKEKVSAAIPPRIPVDAREELGLMAKGAYFKAWEDEGRGYYLPTASKKAVEAYREAMIGKKALRILYYQRSPGFDLPMPELRL
jgi:hypothetical protein